MLTSYIFLCRVFTSEVFWIYLSCQLKQRVFVTTSKKGLFLFSREARVDFILVQECHSSSEDVTFWKNQWGKDLLLTHGTNKSAGVGILKDKFKGQVWDMRADKN